MKTPTLLQSMLAGATTVVMAASAGAGTPTLDGVIGGGEYAHSVVVDKTPDLGGVYDPGSSGSFAGGPVHYHDNRILYWDFDAAFVYFTAAPAVPTGSSCAGSSFSLHLLALTGNPNELTGCEQCTGMFDKGNPGLA